MSAELRIMEQVIQAQVDSHNGRSERATQKAQDLPIKVDPESQLISSPTSWARSTVLDQDLLTNPKNLQKT